MKFSNEIEFNEKITKKRFIAFLKMLKVIDPKEYETESRDGFEDLYNYWVDAGLRRFNIKFDQNKDKL